MCIFSTGVRFIFFPIFIDFCGKIKNTLSCRKMDIISREILRTTLRYELNRKLKDLNRICSNLERLKVRIEERQKEISKLKSDNTKRNERDYRRIP